MRNTFSHPLSEISPMTNTANFLNTRDGIDSMFGGRKILIWTLNIARRKDSFNVFLGGADIKKTKERY